jgi:eukaryotic-like serine/threonine-protein kinase
MSYQAGDEPIRGFKLVRSFGKGSCGEVWQAAHVSGLAAALKIIPLHDQDPGRWLPTIFEAKNVRHPNVLEINRTWLRDTQGNLFGLTQARPLPGWDLIIVMEVGVKNLWDRLQECVKIQPPGIERPELMDYLQGAAKGIDYLNCHGILHGNIKPHNVLLHGGKVKVSDTGHAGLIGRQQEEDDQGVINSRSYWSAEVLRREPHRTSDQYSLAITYYVLRTSKLPYRNASSGTEISTAIVEGRLFPGDLPEGEHAVFAKATHLDPNQRYPSAIKFVESLQIAQANAPTRWPSGAFHRPVN